MYDFRYSQISLTGLENKLTQILPANNNRVTVTVSCGDTLAGSALFIGTEPIGNSIFVRLSNPNTFVMAFRDFGPLVHQSIWVQLLAPTNPTIVGAVEVYKVPESR